LKIYITGVEVICGLAEHNLLLMCQEEKEDIALEEKQATFL